MPDLARVRRVIERLARDGEVTAERDGSRHEVRAVSITAAEGEALRRWVVAEKAVRTIEVGLAYGFSALHIGAGLLEGGDPAAHHVVLDPFQAGRFADCGLQILREAGLANLVEHHAEISQIALPRFLAEERRFDLAFVDGNHRFDGVFLDLFYLGRLLPRGGVVLLDDYNLPGIARAVSFFLTNLGWTVEETSPPDDEHAWVVLRTARHEDRRDFRHFVEF